MIFSVFNPESFLSGGTHLKRSPKLTSEIKFVIPA